MFEGKTSTASEVTKVTEIEIEQQHLLTPADLLWLSVVKNPLSDL